MSAEEHALDIETRMMNDMRKTLREHGLGAPWLKDEFLEELIEALARDGMHHVEQLLTAVHWDE